MTSSGDLDAYAITFNSPSCLWYKTASRHDSEASVCNMNGLLKSGYALKGELVKHFMNASKMAWCFSFRVILAVDSNCILPFGLTCFFWPIDSCSPFMPYTGWTRCARFHMYLL